MGRRGNGPGCGAALQRRAPAGPGGANGGAAAAAEPGARGQRELGAALPAARDVTAVSIEIR